MKTDAIFQKAREGLNRLKLHWKTPPEGYFVNYREFLNLALGSGSLSFLSVIISWTTIAINIPMMISYFKLYFCGWNHRFRAGVDSGSHPIDAD